MEASGLSAAIDEVTPEVYRWLVGNELATAGILDKNLSDLAVAFQAAEHIPAGAMEEVRNCPENLALSALACAGSAEQQDRPVFHVGISLCCRRISWISWNGTRTSSVAWALRTCRCISLAAMRLIRSATNTPRAALTHNTISLSASRRTTPKNPANLVSMNRRLKVNCPRWKMTGAG